MVIDIAILVAGFSQITNTGIITGSMVYASSTGRDAKVYETWLDSGL